LALSYPPLEKMVCGKAFMALCALPALSAFTFGPTIQGPAALVRRASAAMQAGDGAILADGIGPSVKVEGNTLRTWDIGRETIGRVQLSISSEGRPLHTNVELWHTPSYKPTFWKAYTEDGKLRPIHAVIETPKHPKTVAVFNTGSQEFPFSAAVANTGLDAAKASLDPADGESIQGGRIKSYTFGAEVASVQVLLAADERNMKAKIELTQGPNQVKQIFEIYASSGYKNPFYAVIQTPGSVNTIRVINENTVEFPFNAWVLPYEISADSGMQPVMGGGGVMA